MTPAQWWTSQLLLHLIGRNLQRQQPLTAQSSVVFDSCHSRRTHARSHLAPSFAAVLDVRVARRFGGGGLTLFVAGDWSCFLCTRQPRPDATQNSHAARCEVVGCFLRNKRRQRWLRPVEVFPRIPPQASRRWRIPRELVAQRLSSLDSSRWCFTSTDDNPGTDPSQACSSGCGSSSAGTAWFCWRKRIHALVDDLLVPRVRPRPPHLSVDPGSPKPHRVVSGTNVLEYHPVVLYHSERLCRWYA